jgi:hypothetical protein
VQALPISAEIDIDGRLDEPVWSEAEIATDFVQREPDESDPATEKTEIRIVYTPRMLYIGIRAFDSRPESIMAREMGRDAALMRDDSVIILLDTFHDHRNAYFFETNPTASRTDGYVTDEGQDFNIQWDGVWWAASQIDASGWTAEIGIPFWTLRFDPNVDSWGLNVRRLIRRKNETAFWSPIGLDAELFRISRAGHLGGLTGLQQGLNINVKPFITASTGESEDDGAESDFDPGLDVKWGVTKGSSLDLTINTDFAETEVDELQLNLTRFPLFFPEKREFFLENAGIFEFGTPPARRGPLFRLFFSRRIGISEEGEELPMDWGVRLSGKEGKWSLGFLDAQTGELVTDEESVPDNNWAVARVKRNVGGRSSVGVMATRRHADSEDENLTYGVDWNLRPTQKLTIWGFGAASKDPDVEEDNRIFGSGVEWQSSVWRVAAGYVDIGGSFNPEAGFLRREDVKRYDGVVRYEPRPQSSPILNYIFEVESFRFVRPDSSTESMETQIDFFGMRFRSNNRFVLFTQFKEEGLDEPFEIVEGIFIPVGEYRFQDWGARFGTDEGKKLSLRGFLVAGEFFDGDRRATTLSLTWGPSRHFGSQTTWSYTDVDLPVGDFTTNIIRERLSVPVSPNMVASALVQYDDLEELLSVNFRYNWIYRPGADLFVVFNQTWNAPDGLSGLTTRDRRIIVKFTYLWQR